MILIAVAWRRQRGKGHNTSVPPPPPPRNKIQVIRHRLYLSFTFAKPRDEKSKPPSSACEGVGCFPKARSRLRHIDRALKAKTVFKKRNIPATGQRRSRRELTRSRPRKEYRVGGATTLVRSTLEPRFGLMSFFEGGPVCRSGCLMCFRSVIFPTEGFADVLRSRGGRSACGKLARVPTSSRHGTIPLARSFRVTRGVVEEKSLNCMPVQQTKLAG